MSTQNHIVMNLTSKELQILSLLVGEPKYGKEIYDILKEKENLIFLSSLYRILQKLKKKGFLKSEKRATTNKRGGNKRLYYSITAKGQQELNNSYETLKPIVTIPITRKFRFST